MARRVRTFSSPQYGAGLAAGVDRAADAFDRRKHEREHERELLQVSAAKNNALEQLVALQATEEWYSASPQETADTMNGILSGLEGAIDSDRAREELGVWWRAGYAAHEVLASGRRAEKARQVDAKRVRAIRQAQLEDTIVESAKGLMGGAATAGERKVAGEMYMAARSELESLYRMSGPPEVAEARAGYLKSRSALSIFKAVLGSKENLGYRALVEFDAEMEANDGRMVVEVNGGEVNLFEGVSQEDQQKLRAAAMGRAERDFDHKEKLYQAEVDEAERQEAMAIEGAISMLLEPGVRGGEGSEVVEDVLDRYGPDAARKVLAGYNQVYEEGMKSGFAQDSQVALMLELQLGDASSVRELRAIEHGYRAMKVAGEMSPRTFQEGLGDIADKVGTLEPTEVKTYVNSQAKRFDVWGAGVELESLGWIPSTPQEKQYLMSAALEYKAAFKSVVAEVGLTNRAAIEKLADVFVSRMQFEQTVVSALPSQVVDEYRAGEGITHRRRRGLFYAIESFMGASEAARLSVYTEEELVRMMLVDPETEGVLFSIRDAEGNLEEASIEQALDDAGYGGELEDERRMRLFNFRSTLEAARRLRELRAGGFSAARREGQPGVFRAADDMRSGAPR